ncbi:hypothetical protein Lser_V15G01298 [Lactuca serriola]
MFLVGALLRFGFVTAWLFHLVACMVCCLGCDAKHKLIKSQSQSQSQTRPMSKPCMADDTWTSSRFEMDNTRDPSLDSHDFINHGFLLWNQSRQQWIGNKRNRQRNKPREPRLSKNVTYDSLLGSNKPFAKPVPLSEMVDFLGDVWEQEGLYD